MYKGSIETASRNGERKITMELYNQLSELQALIEKARTPRVYGKEEIAKDIIKDFLPDLEEKYPDAVKCFRELLDTMED